MSLQFRKGRAPGVSIIAGLLASTAAVAALAAVVVSAGLSSSQLAAVWMAPIALLVAAAFQMLVAYHLYRRNNWARLVVVGFSLFHLATNSVSLVVALERGAVLVYVALSFALTMLVNGLPAFYLTRPHVKDAFRPVSWADVADGEMHPTAV